MSYTGNLIMKNPSPGYSSNRFTGAITNASTNIKSPSYGYINGQTTLIADAIAILIDSAGNMGTVSSSGRYKDNIKSMNGDVEITKGNKSIIQHLNPVTFRYKTDADKETIRLGLIAEDVEKVYKNLVVYKNNIPETVKYHDIVPILIHEAKLLDSRISAIETGGNGGLYDLGNNKNLGHDIPAVLIQELRDINNDIHNIKHHIENTNGKSSDEKGFNIQTLQKDLDNINISISKQDNIISSFEKTRKSEQSENQQLKNKISDQQTTIESLKKNKDIQSQSIDALKNTTSDQQVIIDTLKNTVNDQQTTIDTLKSTIADQQTTIESLKKSTTKEIKALKTAFEKLNKTLYDIKTKE